MKLNKVIQKAYIEVNEKGTEAAAVSHVRIVTSSIVMSLELILNRPFIYMICEKKNGLILFLGTFNGAQIDTEDLKPEKIEL